jgi:hypothetical protein
MRSSPHNIHSGHTTRRAHKTYTHHEEAQVWGAIATVPGVAV